MQDTDMDRDPGIRDEAEKIHGNLQSKCELRNIIRMQILSLSSNTFH